MATSTQDKSKPPLEAAELQRLVTEVRRGNLSAYQFIYDAYAHRILNYIYRMVGNRDEAEDLMQDTFVMAFRKIGSLQDTAKFQSWLYRIALNNVYQRFRSKRMQWDSLESSDEDSVEEVREIVDSGKDPEQSLLRNELHEVIRQAITELPDRYRQVFVLSAVERLDYQTIAGIFGRSLASIKSDIHRARVEVRDKIKEYLGSPYELSKA